MAILTDIDGQEFSVAGHYVLMIRHGVPVRTDVQTFGDLASLAREVARRRVAYCAARDYAGAPPYFAWALSATGRLLDLLALAAYGTRLRTQDYVERAHPGYVRRRGPVHGIRCFRASGGYGRKYYRRIATTPARRQANLVVFEEGEVAPRAKRNSGNIPNSWFDFSRERQRGWKSQHKGRKAWDREVPGAKGLHKPLDFDGEGA